jgi:hypothetical protein
MEQRQPRILCNEVDFRLLIASQHDDIFENSRGRLSGNFGELKVVAVEMDRMNVIAGVALA